MAGGSPRRPADEADQTGARSQEVGGRSRSRGGAKSRPGDGPAPTRAEPLNEPLPFIEFVGAHPVGSTVHGSVERFTSHGAHVLVGGVRCYVDLAGLGDPPPNRARDVLDQDEAYDFLVLAVDTPRRGIDLALPGSVVAKDAGLTGAAEGRGRSRKTASKAAADAPAKKSGGRTSKKAAASAEPAKSGGRAQPGARKKQQAEPAKTHGQEGRQEDQHGQTLEEGGVRRRGRAPPGGGQRAGHRSRRPATRRSQLRRHQQPPPKKKGLLGRITGR